MRALLRRRALSAANSLRSLTPYERARNAAFALAGLGLLWGLHRGFLRVLNHLAEVELIGPLLIWKLTGTLLLMTLSMTAVSGMLTALTTLFYSFDLKFLMKSPLPVRAVFLDKSLESAFLASWTIGLVLVPFALAVMKALGLGPAFAAAFAAGVPPFLLLGASAGLGFALLLLYVFPSSRTRDAVWALSSLSLAGVYAMARLAQPERLIRAGGLERIAEYLGFLQAPTAPWLPSWWLARAARAAAEGRWGEWAWLVAALWGAALAVYGALVWAAGWAYFEGYSGAQEGAMRRRVHGFRALPFGAPVLWKEAVAFSRDVRHWSQMFLIAGLAFVYLFSIARLPLDSPDLRSLLSFLNVGTAGFVLAALALRFTFPAVSLEGRSWWVLKSAPVDVGAVMRQKLAFSALPTLAVALVLGVSTNAILGADAFTARLTLGALLVAALAICAMAVGFGACFPRFHVENIHQVESSLGGFVFMAASLFYIGGVLALLAGPMRMHYAERFGRAAWDWPSAAAAGAGWIALNAAAFVVPWTLGRRTLETYEG